MILTSFLCILFVCTTLVFLTLYIRERDQHTSSAKTTEISRVDQISSPGGSPDQHVLKYAFKNGKNVGFRLEHMVWRGTDIAVFDYAYFNYLYLHNNSVIFCLESGTIDEPVRKKFESNFTVKYYQTMADLTRLCEEHNIHTLYYLCYGNQESFPEGVRTANHGVFVDSPFGDTYAVISPVVSAGSAVVPHMIWFPECPRETLRAALNIPEDAVVCGRYGGESTFSLGFVHRAVEKVLTLRNDIYFIFMNTATFMSTHPRVIHLPPSADLMFKAKFIQTCDYMLHAREDGETFGLAVGEFAFFGKPVLTFDDPNPHVPTMHVRILGDDGIYYTSENIVDILSNLTQSSEGYKTNRYLTEYCPERVMDRFNEIFLCM